MGRPMKATRSERDRSTAAAVLAHPLRVRILAILNERDMSPVEFCREGFAPADMDVSHVAYHFRELAEYGCLTVVEENKRRGSIEHVYRGIGRAYFSDAEWSALDQEERVRISKTIVQGLMARVEEAMMAGTFDARGPSPQLDRDAARRAGLERNDHALAAAFGEVEQIRTDAERRLDATGRTPIPSTCGILGFPSPSVPSARTAGRVAA